MHVVFIELCVEVIFCLINSSLMLVTSYHILMLLYCMCEFDEGYHSMFVDSVLEPYMKKMIKYRTYLAICPLAVL